MPGILFLVFILSGTIGIAYGLKIVIDQRAQIYRRGEIQLYEGKAAQAIGSGLAVAGLGAVALGSLGFSAATMIFGILCSAAFFVGRSYADRLQSQNSDFALPSQKKK